MKINNMERFQPLLMELLCKQQTQMAPVAKPITITVEILPQLQEMLDRDQPTQAMLLKIGVEITYQRPKLHNLLLKMEIQTPTGRSAIM